MRAIGKTFVPPARDRIEFGAEVVRSYSFPLRSARDPKTGVTADVSETLAGDLDTFMRERLLLK